jgi:phosphoribosylanthranilate isomerase
VFVKICGVTTEEDALLAVAMGADAVGFNFVPSSPRRVEPDDVRAIVRRLPAEIVTVGVFRDETPQHVIEVVARTGLNVAQLHGHESRADVEQVRQHVPSVIQAVAAGDDAMVRAAGSPADVVLVDSPSPGSGKIFDWKLAEGAPRGMRLLLAGGLDPDNVTRAIRQVHPWGVDVATGVEASPGRKDATKVRLFVERAKLAGAEVATDGWEQGAFRPYDWQDDE